MRSWLISSAVFLCLPLLSRAKDDYKLGPDSEVHKDVPQGKIEKFTWKSDVFAGRFDRYSLLGCF